ncbi:FAD binding domain-containing protein [Mycolicibacterium vaccae]|uniref:FAD binding domain-containing protein n=1 Tax=Mycolicibacterium vaccae TaxID=1810 RepID=UPI003CF61C5A
MKPAAFDYHRPDTLAEAAEILGRLGDDAKVLAGGQSLVPMLAMRLTHFENLVDISRVEELCGIDPVDGAVRVGSTTSHALVGLDDEVADSVPLLTLATPHIGHFQIRSRGTLGGAIAHADPAAEYAAVALALDAEMEATSTRGTRVIPAADFFTGLWENSLAGDEILRAVRFPVWHGRCGFAVEEFARRHGDFAIAGAVVAVELDATDRVQRCGIGLLGLGSTPLRGSAAETAVLGRSAGELDEDALDEIGRVAMDAIDDIPADLQGSAAYRAQVGSAMVARALGNALAAAITETSSTRTEGT